MKKHILALTLTIVSFNAIAHNSFSGLTPFIQKSADTWIKESLSTLSFEDQLTFLNLFIAPTASSVEATIKCIQLIQTNDALKLTTETLQNTIQTVIEKYVDAMEKKFGQKKTMPTQEDLQEFFQKLEKKIYELIEYFNKLYYEKLYTHLAKQDATKLAYMFDENGIITPEKRTRLLPQLTH